jgi:hypothetical protein
VGGSPAWSWSVEEVTLPTILKFKLACALVVAIGVSYLLLKRSHSEREEGKKFQDETYKKQNSLLSHSRNQSGELLYQNGKKCNSPKMTGGDTACKHTQWSGGARSEKLRDTEFDQ